MTISSCFKFQVSTVCNRKSISWAVDTTWIEGSGQWAGMLRISCGYTKRYPWWESVEALSDRSKSNDRHQLILAARVTAISPGMVAPCKHAPAMCCFMLFQGMHSFLARIAGKSCSSKMELLHVQICPPVRIYMILHGCEWNGHSVIPSLGSCGRLPRKRTSPRCASVTSQKLPRWRLVAGNWQVVAEDYGKKRGLQYTLHVLEKGPVLPRFTVET